MEVIRFALMLLTACLIITPFIIFAASGVVFIYFKYKTEYENAKIKNTVNAIFNKENKNGSKTA